MIKKFLIMGALLLGALAFAIPAQAATASPVVYGFGTTGAATGWTHPLTQPRILYLGQGGAPIVTIRSWPAAWKAGSPTATSADAIWLNSCRPTCAQAPYVRHSATLLLWGQLRHNGQPYYSRLNIRWAGGRMLLAFGVHGGTVAAWYTLSAVVTPPPPPPVMCHPKTPSDGCYEPGEFCSKAQHNTTGLAGDGKTIACRDDNGTWRWLAT
jgi:hypothetical protein